MELNSLAEFIHDQFCDRKGASFTMALDGLPMAGTGEAVIYFFPAGAYSTDVDNESEVLICCDRGGVVRVRRLEDVDQYVLIAAGFSPAIAGMILLVLGAILSLLARERGMLPQSKAQNALITGE